MPIVIVNGVHPDLPHKSRVIPLVQQTVASVKNLGIHRDQVSVFMPTDVVKEGLGEEIIVFVEGLLAKPGRTDVERDELAEKLKVACWECFPGNPLVEVFVRPFVDASHGFAAGRKNS